MAKKTFNISSTLSKNKESQLAKKIPLKKTPKNEEIVEHRVAKIHGEQPEKEEKKPNTKEKAKKKTTLKKPEKLVRLTIDTPVEMHKKLKIRSIEKGVSMRDYILELIYKELK